jgi:chromosome partitioning protein
MLLTMYDSRLRLSNQVVEEVKQHFQQLVFETIIPRNVKLSEAPSFGQSILMYDATSSGSSKYLDLAKEVIARNGVIS